MRAGYMLLGFVLSGVVAACGGAEKKAKDPTDPPPPSADEPTRWEGASTERPDENAPTKPGRSGAVVDEQPARRGDQYDKEATETVLRRQALQVKNNCGAAKGEDGKASGPWGPLTIQVTLGHNGHSKGVSIPPPYEGAPVGRCIEKAFTNLTFPPWGGSDTTIPWDVELVAPPK